VRFKKIDTFKAKELVEKKTEFLLSDFPMFVDVNGTTRANIDDYDYSIEINKRVILSSNSKDK